MQEVDRLKSNFLATISHELRTPLTSVIGYAEMLLEGLAGNLTQDQREYVQIIMEKGDQLLQLITGILDVSRMEHGTLPMLREVIHLPELINGTLGALAPLARRKKIDLRPVPSLNIPRVTGDRDKLRQVLLNLFGNAIKFTREGGTLEVQLTVGPLVREEDMVARARLLKPAPGAAPSPNVEPAPASPYYGVRMRVTDSGIGIAPEKQARIFEPFFQVDASSTREYGGTGLGLTLVKSYIEAHGGHVWVDSDLGRGSTFTITLPAVPSELEAYFAEMGAPLDVAPASASEPDATTTVSSLPGDKGSHV